MVVLRVNERRLGSRLAVVLASCTCFTLACSDTGGSGGTASVGGNAATEAAGSGGAGHETSGAGSAGAITTETGGSTDGSGGSARGGAAGSDANGTSSVGGQTTGGTTGGSAASGGATSGGVPNGGATSGTGGTTASGTGGTTASGTGGTTASGGSGGTETSGGTAGSGTASGGSPSLGGSGGAGLGGATGTSGTGGVIPATCVPLSTTCGNGESFTTTASLAGYDSYQCNATGDGYALLDDCTEGEYCYPNSCQPHVCTPSKRYCLDQYRAGTCTATGSGTTLIQDCRAAKAYCSEGLCVEAPFFEDFEPVGGKTWFVVPGTSQMFNNWSWTSVYLHSADDGDPAGDEIWLNGGKMTHALAPIQPTLVGFEQYCTDSCSFWLLNESFKDAVSITWDRATGELRIYGPSGSMNRVMTGLTDITWLHFEITNMDFTDYTYALRVSHFGEGGSTVYTKSGIFFVNPSASITGLGFDTVGTSASFLSGWDSIIVY